MKRLLILALTIACFTQCAQQQSAPVAKAASEPKFEVKVNPEDIVSIRYDDDLMREAKAAYQANDPAFMKVFNPYKQSIESRFLNMKAVSITDDIKHMAPSGDPRDYITPSPYWFPDPDTDDGLPYIRFDGVRNPWLVEFPGVTLADPMANGSENLAFLYYITGDEKYAVKAAEVLRTWFLDPVKGMNPNIVFAQYVPGMKRIRGTGLLAARGTVGGAVNAAKMLVPSQAWTDKDEAEMQDWAKAFLYWMEYSTHGQEEHKGGNNHAMWYEATREVITLYTQDYDHLADIILKYQLPRFSEQIAADSTMPHEVARTLGLHYMTFTLSAVTQTSTVARKIGMADLISNVGPNGRSMLWGLDLTAYYWQNPEEWPYMQIRPPVESNIPNILYQAHKSTGNKKYEDLAYQFGFDGIASYGQTPGIINVLHYKYNK